MKVIFCIPGKKFSGVFLSCWTNLICDTRQRGIEGLLRNVYSANVYHCRTRLVKGDIDHKGRVKSTKPFGGTIDYDYLMWIDSDMVFLPKDFRDLLRRDVDIITGLAITDAMSGRLNCGKFGEKGNAVFYLQTELPDIERNAEGLLEVDFCGFAWVLIKRGVFESMDFPWFRPMITQYDDVLHFPSEDLGWCMQARMKGFKIYADPEVRIGHEKSAILKVKNVVREPVEA